MSATMRRLAMPVAGFACLLFSVAAEARDAIDFGELLPGSDTVRRFELKNDGTNGWIMVSVTSGPGVNATICADTLMPGESVPVCVSVRTGPGSGMFESYFEVHAAGREPDMARFVVRGSVVDGDSSGKSLVEDGRRVTWKCSSEVAKVAKGVFDGSWESAADSLKVELLCKWPWAEERDRLLVRRRIPPVLRAAHAEIGGEYVKGENPLEIPGLVPVDPEALQYFRLLERCFARKQAISDRIAAEEGRRRVEKMREEFDAALESRRLARLKADEEKMKEFWAAAEADKRRRERDRQIAIASRELRFWRPPEYFTESFATNQWLKFLCREMCIPGGVRGEPYRKCLAQAMVPEFLRVGERPYSNACERLIGKGVQGIDPKHKAGFRTRMCFSWLYGLGDRRVVSFTDESGKTRNALAPSGVYACAEDGRKGDCYRFLGAAHGHMYYKVNARFEGEMTSEMKENRGKGVDAAVAWCAALNAENPTDDLWQRCVYPFIHEAFISDLRMFEGFVAKTGEFLGADTWLMSVLKSDLDTSRKIEALLEEKWTLCSLPAPANK
jgi:hypothetical protein